MPAFSSSAPTHAQPQSPLQPPRPPSPATVEVCVVGTAAPFRVFAERIPLRSPRFATLPLRYTDPLPMNAAEHFICSSSLWRQFTGRKLLPWILNGASLGDHLLEIGAGYGPATGHLQTRVGRITSLEYDHSSSLQLKSQNNRDTIAAVQGDATQLPFACKTFSSALAILVLHHLKSSELQDQMFAEAFRVLRPGGVFIAFEIPGNWLHRVGHIRSTFTPASQFRVCAPHRRRFFQNFPRCTPGRLPPHRHSPQYGHRS